MGQIEELQKQVWANKKAKGFNTANVEREFNYVYAELAEAYDSYRKAKGDVGEELADTAIFLMGLAEMLDIDLETEVLNKIAINESRKYKKDNQDHFIKEEE